MSSGESGWGREAVSSYPPIAAAELQRHAVAFRLALSLAENLQQELRISSCLVETHIHLSGCSLATPSLSALHRFAWLTRGIFGQGNLASSRHSWAETPCAARLSDYVSVMREQPKIRYWFELTIVAFITAQCWSA